MNTPTLLIFSHSCASPLAVAARSHFEANGYRAFFRAAPCFKRSDGLEKCDAVWVEPEVGRGLEILEAYSAAGAEILVFAPQTRTSLERIEQLFADTDEQQHFVNVTTLDDDEPMQLEVDEQPQPRRRGRPRKQR